METRCQKIGQTEIGTITHNGAQFSAFGSTVRGREIAAYTRRNKRGDIELTSWCGKVMLSCRSEVVRTYNHEFRSPAAIVFSLTGGRFIVGLESDGNGSLFRGELFGPREMYSGGSDAEGYAHSVAEYWLERDAEDDAAFDAEQEAEWQDPLGAEDEEF